jgi:hypothetical protein
MAEPDVELLIARLTLVETISVFAIKVRTGEFNAAEFGRLRALFASDVGRRRYLSADQRLCGIATAEGLSVINPELFP